MKPNISYLKWQDSGSIIKSIKNGGIACVPTETVAGLIGLPEQKDKINKIKGSPPEKALSYFCANMDQALNLWGNLPSELMPLTHFWPGPLTLLYGEKNLIGIRIPKVPELLEILNETGPLASTSANFSTENAATEIANVPTQLLQNVDFVIDEKVQAAGQASTIIKYQHKKWHLIREGSIIPSLPGISWS